MIFATGIITALVNLSIGALVLINNPKKRTNVPFFLLTLILSGYALSIFYGFSSTIEARFLFGIRTGCYVGALLPPALHLLCLAIENPDSRLTSLLVRIRWTFLFSQIAGLISISNYFLVGAIMPDSPEAIHLFPEGILGSGYHFYNIYFPIAFTYIIASFVKRMRNFSGLQRNEFQFVLLGMATFAILAFTIAMIIPTATGKNQAQIYAPLAILPLDAIIAYGIATSRIMEVGYILRRIAAYGLLTVYLGVLYFGTWWISSHLVHPLLPVTDNWLPHFFAALVVAFSMAAAQGRMQRFANKLFGSRQDLNLQHALGEVNRLILSINTLPNLLSRFSQTVAGAVGTDSVSIYLQNGAGFEQSHLDEDTHGPYPERLPEEDVLVSELRLSRDALVLDELKRRRTSPRTEELKERLTELNAQVAVGIRSPHRLEGIMFLGPRLSGRIYGADESNALPILCEQLAVALENAALYTETRDSKIYNEVLLDNLASGVVAADGEGVVTVANREAQRMLGRGSDDLIGKPIGELPEVLEKSIRETLRSELGLHDIEAPLRLGNEEDTPIRIASSIFRSHKGEILGALVVFSDVTHVKKLETQVRRHDRLASIGTLAAGMAHEIKNPLVTVKTFTQLLPERYQDEEFRGTFTDLIGSEVKRIDTIVNQLLNFARPATPDLKPTHLHELANHCLRLSEQQMKQKNIQVFAHLVADDDLILADANLLQQALVNFFLNATEAMSNGGSLYVTTGTEHDPRPNSLPTHSSADSHIRITIRDTGEGIAEENLASIFDPFFTTKGHGTGLGLSVSHGIIDEHDGHIEVESEVGKGTTFSLSFPLMRREAVA